MKAVIILALIALTLAVSLAGTHRSKKDNAGETLAAIAKSYGVDYLDDLAAVKRDSPGAGERRGWQKGSAATGLRLHLLIYTTAVSDARQLSLYPQRNLDGSRAA
jgi:hypothetical protein